MRIANLAHYKKMPACPFCAGTYVRKHGFARSHIQRYRCPDCAKTFQTKYIYQTDSDRQMIKC